MGLAQAKAEPMVVAREIRTPRGLVLHRVDIGDFRTAYFDPDYWLAQDRARATSTGRGSSWFVDADEGRWVLRHYRRGGAVARLMMDRYVWSGYERSRSVREWRLLAHLQGLGLPAPVPVAARVDRSTATYCADLITEMIPGTRAMSALLEDGTLTEARLVRVGACLRRFHDAQIWHADLNAHNILLNDVEDVFVIDFDRARERPGLAWKAANLRRLRRSLDKLSVAAFPASGWDALQSGYDRGTALG